MKKCGGALTALLVLGTTVAACGGSSPATEQNTQALSGPLPTVVTTGVPSSWVPVPYGNIQISVPGSWTVASNGEFTCEADGGSVYVGRSSTSYGALRCPARTLVSMVPFDSRVKLTATTSLEVNGISVQARADNTPTDAALYVPDLGVTLIAQGPESLRVLKTLTYSPLAVVTAAAPSTPAPSSWKLISFGGISVKVPRSWPVGRTTSVGYCSTNVNPDEVMLSTAEKSYVLGCPAPIPQASELAANQGLLIFSGPHAGKAVIEPTTSRTLSVHGLELDLSRSSETGGTMVATISLPGHANPVVLWLGLAGDGLIPRGIVDSIEAS